MYLLFPGWLYPQGEPQLNDRFSYHSEITMPFTSSVINAHVSPFFVAICVCWWWFLVLFLFCTGWCPITMIIFKFFRYNLLKKSYCVALNRATEEYLEYGTADPLLLHMQKAGLLPTRLICNRVLIMFSDLKSKYVLTVLLRNWQQKLKTQGHI